jgi:hypothetical protein
MFASKDVFITKNPTSQYQIAGSLATESPYYMDRTNVTPSNANKYTLSFWYKTVSVVQASTYSVAFNGAFNSGVVSPASYDNLAFETNGQISYRLKNSFIATTSYVFFDPMAWYHIVIAVDVTQATSTAGLRIFVNGVLQTIGSTSGTYVQNSTPNMNVGGVVQSIGRRQNGSITGKGSIADVYFLDGVTPSTTTKTINGTSRTILTVFGQFNGGTGQWTPISYTGSYGNNGGHWTFADTSSLTNLGLDSSGNGNHYTASGYILTSNLLANYSYDSPTPYTGSDGIVRGNYDTLNPFATPTGNFNFLTFINGKTAASNTSGSARSTIGAFDLTGGNWYWEVLSPPTASTSISVGLNDDVGNSTSLATVTTSAGGVQEYLGLRYTDSSRLLEKTSDGTNWTTVATVPATTTTSWQKIVVLISALANSRTGYYNSGMRPFNWTKPTGYKVLCQTNNTLQTISCPTDYYRTTTYTGTGATQSISNVSNSGNSTNLQPAIVWILGNTSGQNQVTYSSLLGATNSLDLSATTAKTTKATGLTAFNTDGFSLGADAQANTNTTAYYALQWAINSSSVTNTSGTVTSTVQADPTIGTSLVTFTSPSSAGAFTVGHGLNTAPQFIMLRSTGATGSVWFCYHWVNGNTVYVPINGSTAGATSGIWNNTTPTSTLVHLNTSALTLSNTYEMFCFNSVKGYSSFGYLDGQGIGSSALGVNLGFTPAFFMRRQSGTASATWLGFQTASASNEYNTTVGSTAFLRNEVGLTSTFSTIGSLDAIYLTSYGFLDFGSLFSNIVTYIYCAWAKSPFNRSVGY